jgi:hypothetical protein
MGRYLSGQILFETINEALPFVQPFEIYVLLVAFVLVPLDNQTLTTHHRPEIVFCPELVFKRMPPSPSRPASSRLSR